MTLRSPDMHADLVRAEMLRVARRLETHGLACAAVLLAAPTLETWAAIAADFAAARTVAADLAATRTSSHRPLRAEHLAAVSMTRGDVDSAVALLAHAEGLSSPEWIAARGGR